MRQSRRFCLLQPGGVRWKKYNCTASTGSYTYYIEGAATHVANYSRDSTLSGASSYSFNQNTGTYSVSGSVSIPVGSGGTIYGGGGSQLTIHSVAGWDYDIYTQGVEQRTNYYTIYTKGDYIGDVRAKQDEKPDAKNGYTFVENHVFDGQTYTIMSYGGRYYAYIQA